MSQRIEPTSASPDLVSVRPGVHEHVFDEVNPLAERNTRRVVWLTAIMMVLEIAGGWYFHSMALLADGWHMSSHAIALGLSAAAYALARRLRHDDRFAFGTWKIEVLGGYTSAVLLVGIALYMAYESVVRLAAPLEIHFNEAIPVAILGLGVNLYSAWILSRAGHEHGHDHGPGHSHAHHGHQDLNLRSAYIHVAADAATSVLAILALSGGKYLGLVWLDPIMGIVGAGVVSAWAFGLIRSTGRTLLDAHMDAPIVEEIRDVIRSAPVTAEIRDLHVWQVGKGKYACVVSVALDEPHSSEDVRQWLSVHEELVHITVEVHRV